MKPDKKYFLSGMSAFVLLWATQGLSTLGSSMTSYALVVWCPHTRFAGQKNNLYNGKG